MDADLDIAKKELIAAAMDAANGTMIGPMGESRIPQPLINRLVDAANDYEWHNVFTTDPEGLQDEELAMFRGEDHQLRALRLLAELDPCRWGSEWEFIARGLDDSDRNPRHSRQHPTAM
jgi:hypothetical protein